MICRHFGKENIGCGLYLSAVKVWGYILHYQPHTLALTGKRLRRGSKFDLQAQQAII